MKFFKNTKIIFPINSVLLRTLFSLFYDNTKIGFLQFDPKIDKTEQAFRKAAWLARERTEQHETIPIQDYSSDESEMRDERRITLGYYGRLDNLDEI